MHAFPRANGRVRRAFAPAAATCALSLVAMAIGGCGLVGPRTFRADVPDEMTVTSPDVAAGQLGPAFTCHGPGKHPGLRWSGAPQGTRSFAVVMDDAAAPIRPYVYWIIFDIGPQRTEMQAAQIPPGARQSLNSKGSVGYDPPCPVKQSHEYRFTVYALGVKMLSLKPHAPLESAWSAIARVAIARGRLPVTVNP